MGNHVFISHSRDDSPAADLLVQALEERGVLCWLAPRDVPAGGSYAESILDAIESASCFVLIYSQNANVSSHVMREVERALKFGINIVPIRFDDSTPSKSLDYLLATVHWLAIAPDARDRSIVRAAEQILAAVSKSQSTPPSGEPESNRAPSYQPVAASVSPPKRHLLWVGAAVVALGGGLIGFLVSRNSGSVHGPQPSGVAATTTAASPAISAPATSSVNTAESPLAVTHRYFDFLGKRNATAAYNLLSANFRSHLAIAKYSNHVSTIPRARLVEATIVSKNERTASVAAVFAEANPASRLPPWRGPIELVLEADGWRIESMKGLVPANGYPLPDSSKGSNEDTVRDAGQSAAPPSITAQPPAPPSKAVHPAMFGVVQDPAGRAHVREEPFVDSKLVTILENGAPVEIDRMEGGWAHVILRSGQNGFIQKHRLNITPAKQ